MGNEECASTHPFSLFRSPRHRCIPLFRSPVLVFVLVLCRVWTGHINGYLQRVGSARLAGSSWRHEAATTSAICFEYELTIALVKCHEHVYRCITTRMIRMGFRISRISFRSGGYLRFSPRSGDGTGSMELAESSVEHESNGTRFHLFFSFFFSFYLFFFFFESDVCGYTLRMKRFRPMVFLCFRNWNNWKTARDEVNKLGSFVVGEVFTISNCFVGMWFGIYQIFHLFRSCCWYCWNIPLLDKK